MKLCMFTPVAHEIRGWPGRIEGDRVIQLAAQTLESFFTGGGQAREHAEYPLAEVRLLAPIRRPPSVRDFYAFEGHVKNARAVTGRGEVPPEWYEIPVFYFSNPAAIYGPDEEIPYPEGTEKLDYELEVAVVMGADGAIGGFTVMNDWSARDLQRQEMKVGLGPAKGKDFATSLGPVVVTPDELGDLRLEMVARVNGEERSRGNLGDMYHSWEAIVAQAGRNTELRPGDVLGSGTVGTGCILEHGDERWLQPGDEVELEVEGIGVLRNRIGAPHELTLRSSARGSTGSRRPGRSRVRGATSSCTSSSRPGTRAGRATGARGSSGWPIPRKNGCASRRRRSPAGASSRPRAARRCSASPGSSSSWTTSRRARKERSPLRASRPRSSTGTSSCAGSTFARRRASWGCSSPRPATCSPTARWPRSRPASSDEAAASSTSRRSRRSTTWMRKPSSSPPVPGPGGCSPRPGSTSQVVETRETVLFFRLERETPVPSTVTMVDNLHGFYSVYDPVYGLKVGHHKSGVPADPDEEGGPDQAIVDEVTEWAGRTFSLAQPEPVEVQTCFYTNTADDSFVLERHGRIVVGSACSGHAFKFGPAVGARLADLAQETTS